MAVKTTQAERQFTGAWLEGWTLFPQDASGDLQLCPFTSKLCMYCNVVCLAMALGTHMFFEYSETVPCARHTTDATMPGYLNMTAKLAFAGLCYESLWFVCIRWMGLASLYRSDMKLRKRLRLNLKMIWVFTMLTTLYHFMAFDLQFVHVGWLARFHGGHQLVYSVRFLEWTVCAPVVLSVNGQLDNAPNGAPRNGMIPSSLLTGIYCIISWQGLVVQNAVLGWVLVGFAFFSYLVASVEQWYLANYFKDKGNSGPVKAALLYYLVVTMGVYGIWYLLPIPGWMTTTLENKLYCFGDASFKLGTNIMLIVTEDVCAVMQMRQRSQVLAHNLENLIDTASVPIIGVDSTGKVTEINMKADALLRGDEGYSAIGLLLYDLVVPQDRANCQNMVQRTLKNEQAPNVEVRLRGTSSFGGKAIHPALDLSASCRKDVQTGKVIGVTLIGHDITSLREAEDRKTRFMATVSHELRSPLHGVIGLADYLQTSETDQDRSKSLEMITSCSKRMLGLVVDIMDMADMSVKETGATSGKQILHKDPVELSKILEEVIGLMERATDKQGRRLVKQGVLLINNVQRMPVIEADAAKCNQVFFNLITNACKFTHAGTITISSNVAPDSEWVEVIISDTGMGISADSIDRIFAPFEQEDNSSGRAHEGIGLGLAIAHKIVKMHGGEIQVTSEVGRGSTFKVRLPTRAASPLPTADTLPAMEAPAPARGLQEPASGPGQTTSLPGQTTSLPRKSALPPPDASRKKPAILSVDDDQVNQAIVKRLLGSDYHVHTVMNGEEGCKFLKSNPIPDAVLLDSMMPGLTGPEVLKVIRQDWGVSAQELPVLMVSAASSPEEVIEALDLGASDHISKPFDSDMLKARLRTAMRNCGATPPWVKNDPTKAATDDNLGAGRGLRSRQPNRDFRKHRSN